MLYFALYSIIGWICEEVVYSIQAKKWVNRGFLHGPYCPIYGFGALILLILLRLWELNPALLFIAAVMLASILEYFTSWLMEKLFGLRWWDYSDRKFTIHGRVCLLYSLLFGVMGISMAYIIHPFFSGLLHRLSENTARTLSNVFVLVFLADFVVTLGNMADLKSRLIRMKDELDKIQKLTKDSSWLDRGDLEGSLERLNERLQAQNMRPIPEGTIEKFRAIASKNAGHRRLLDAFPTMAWKDNGVSVDSLREMAAQERARLAERRNVFVQKARDFRERQLLEPPKKEHIAPNEAAFTPGRTVEDEISFAYGINGYKLCWVFFIACILGFFAETIYCFIVSGYVGSRQGMLYGPFNQVYGFGAVLMVLALSPLAKYKNGWIFLGNALVGGAFEWICSWVQEKVFGSISWDYSSQSLSIGGRTSVMYMIFWGLLGLFFIRSVYPALSRQIERIPNRLGRALTAIIAVILCADMLLSALAVHRWVRRDAGMPPTNAAAAWLDEKYPDEFMETVYPGMDIQKLEIKP